MKVVKRDGSIEDFDILKVLNAVKKAYTIKEKLIDSEVENEINQLTSTITKDPVNVEDIQDEVVKILMDLAPYDVALEYILYREKHKQARFIRERIDYMNKYSSSSYNAATSTE